MLVISRKKNQSIKLGRDITIKIIDLGHGRVKIGVEAPANISISRVDEFGNTCDEQKDIKKS